MNWQQLVHQAELHLQLAEAVTLPAIPGVYTPTMQKQVVDVAPEINVNVPGQKQVGATNVPPAGSVSAAAPGPKSASPVSTSFAPNATAGEMRQQFQKELSNPVVANKFATLMAAEVGTSNAQSQAAFAETVFNRALATGKSVDQVISNAKYYQPYTDGGFNRAARSMTPQKAAALQQSINAALQGTNITRGATDAGSASVAASVKRGGYDAVPDSVMDIGGETFYRKDYYKNASTLKPLTMQ
jgi:hypothetical protein